MRCYICDSALSDEEVQFNRVHDDWDPCGTCKQVIKDVFKEDRDEGTLADEGYDDGTAELEEMLDIDGGTTV